MGIILHLAVRSLAALHVKAVLNRSDVVELCWPMFSGLRYNVLRPSVFLQERGEGSLNTTSSGLATGMKDDGTMAYQADAEGEGSGSDPAGS